MISHLQGELVARTTQAAYIDVNGVGYEIFMSQSALSQLPEIGQTVHVLTYLQVSDSALTLYGFNTDEEKDLFEKLISVSGIGPKIALSALSVYNPRDLISAIIAQDVSLVSRIPGIGNKSASRIILELKGSFDQDASLPGTDAASSSAVMGDTVKEALLSMGFTTSEIALALKDAPQDARVDELLHYALKRLGADFA